MDVVLICKNVCKMVISVILFVMLMFVKEMFMVRELFVVILVGFLNSGVIVLGEYVVGSNDKFIKLMN